jgi:DNA-binding CsgD family transcriptional regulator
LPAGIDAELVDLIGGIYDAVIEPGLWPDVCEALRLRLEFKNAEIATMNVRTGEAVVSAVIGIPAQYLAVRTPERIREVMDMWGGERRLAQYPLEEPVLLSDVSDQEQWDRSEYIRLFAVPQELVDSVAIPLARDARTIGSISFGVHSSRRSVSPDDLSWLRLLAPHLRRAVQISGILDDATAAAESFSAVLDATSSGVVIVDRDTRILHANAAAQPMLAAGDPIREVGGRLLLREELVPGQLMGAIRGATDEAALGRRGLGIPTRRLDGSPLTATVMPLERRASRSGVSASAAAAVLIATSAPLELPAGALSLLYDLTPAEVRVFELVVEGNTNVAVAKALGISPSTVKTHMSRMFDKLGVSTRVELFKIAHSIKLP